MAVGDRVRRARDLKMWTQDILSEEASVSVNSISNIEAGHVTPRYATVRKLAEALEVDPSYLWSGVYASAPLEEAPSRQETGLVDALEKALDDQETPVEEIAKLLNLSGHRFQFLVRTLKTTMIDEDREKLETERQRIQELNMEAVMRVTGPGSPYAFGENPRARVGQGKERPLRKPDEASEAG
jgi:transcriptional regulator with XRE-family HTH domain